MQLHMPHLAHWTQHAARLLLPHSMRDVADLLMGDGWRPGLADALPGSTGGGGSYPNGTPTSLNPTSLGLSSSSSSSMPLPQRPPPWHRQQLPQLQYGAAMPDSDPSVGYMEAVEGEAETGPAVNQRLRARPLQPTRMPPMPPAGLAPHHRPIFSKHGTSRYVGCVNVSILGSLAMSALLIGNDRE